MNVRHGHAIGGVQTPTWKSWSAMMGRCYQPKSRCYEDYGGSGVKVCERWHLFENFLADLGERPSRDHVLDRIDNARGYEPGNCRWLTRLESARNKTSNLRITYKGKTQALTAWCQDLELPYETIVARIRKYGWPVERAIETPVRRWRRKIPRVRKSRTRLEIWEGSYKSPKLVEVIDG